MRQDTIIWKVLGGEHKGHSKLAFAVSLCRAIYPGPIDTFQCHRWVTNLLEFQKYNLLMNTHNLGERAIRRWLVILRGKVPPSLAEYWQNRSVRFVMNIWFQ